ncbi:HCP-like protein [Anaeromyces robustus]|jgi:TPR repeat protein|uniref:HCP-like protein n=1 Tax=Anaeromyces robustus TaxID=1754192 RepID=A0A1Y1X3X8_9FUNG|nr:HCP-like protein [Anaeromyces robustus]|eukprot:ORX80014.1 HCP-like protein [Anaeromyces robustus]
MSKRNYLENRSSIYSNQSSRSSRSSRTYSFGNRSNNSPTLSHDSRVHYSPTLSHDSHVHYSPTLSSHSHDSRNYNSPTLSSHSHDSHNQNSPTLSNQSSDSHSHELNINIDEIMSSEFTDEDYYNVQPKTYISETVKWSAKKGNVDAMYVMGLFFLGYYRCTPDHRKAFHWFKEAAYQGNSDAAYQVAHCYEFGIGIASNETEAIRWYHEAGRRHYYLAEKKLAFCYSAGKLGCYPDINNADKWHDCYMKNPERTFFENKERWNIPRELLEAGYTFESKIFKGEKYLVNAVKYAATHKSINAKYCLGLLYTSGFGGNEVLPKDKNKAIEIFEELVKECHHPESMYCLARLYEEGQSDGTQPKLYLALKLYKEAARHGEEAAKKVLNDLKSMPMDDQSRAFKNEVKRSRQVEYLKQQRAELDYKRNHYIKTRVKTVFRL